MNWGRHKEALLRGHKKKEQCILVENKNIQLTRTFMKNRPVCLKF